MSANNSSDPGKAGFPRTRMQARPRGDMRSCGGTCVLLLAVGVVWAVVLLANLQAQVVPPSGISPEAAAALPMGDKTDVEKLYRWNIFQATGRPFGGYDVPRNLFYSGDRLLLAYGVEAVVLISTNGSLHPNPLPNNRYFCANVAPDSLFRSEVYHDCAEAYFDSTGFAANASAERLFPTINAYRMRVYLPTRVVIPPNTNWGVALWQSIPGPDTSGICGVGEYIGPAITNSYDSVTVHRDGTFVTTEATRRGSGSFTVEPLVTPAPLPQLQLSRENPGLKVWTASELYGLNWSLQTCTNLPTTNWQEVAVLNQTNRIWTGIPATLSFYRLQFRP